MIIHGYSYVGIEREIDYINIAKKRVEHAAEPESEELEDATQMVMSLG